jgi:hypothetical protein
VFVISLCLFALGVRGRLKAAKVLKTSCLVLLSSVGMLGLGVLVSWLCCMIAGARFKLFGVIHGVQFDNIAMIAVIALMSLGVVLVYAKKRSNAVRNSMNSIRSSASVTAASHYAYNALYGTLSLMFVLSAVLLLALGENLMFMVPLTFATAGILLYRLTSMRLWLLVSVFATLLHAFSFLHSLSMALTIGAFGAVLMLAFIDLMMLIPLVDLYLMPGKKR